MPPEIDFIQQKTVHSQYKVTPPNKVKKRLGVHQSGEGMRARWNINEESKDVVISTEQMKEPYTAVQDFTKINKPHTNVVVPERVRELLDIENAEDKQGEDQQGDDVYFIGMSDDETPISAVLFWPFERMSEMLVDGNESQSYGYLRALEFL